MPIIGQPVDNVFSPPAYNDWFMRNGVNCRMIALDLNREGIEPFLAVLRGSKSFVGCSVTYPYKQQVLSLVDSASERAWRVGALNTIRRDTVGRLSGEATDGIAMADAIEARSTKIKGASATILGAGGGAGFAIADAFCEREIAELALLDVDEGRLAAVVSRLTQYWPKVRISTKPEAAHLLVNATTLGKKPEDRLPFDTSQIGEAEVICDVVTGPKPTRLIGLAGSLGRKTVSGADMGSAQLRPQIEFLGL